MRVLIDECVPQRLRHELAGHDVHTVLQLGWSGKKNGELLKLMATRAFDVMLTVDRNIRHQQNLQAAGVAIIILVGPSNRLDDLLPLVPSAQLAFGSIKPGDIVEILT